VSRTRRLSAASDFDSGGKFVVNPSGGLLTKGVRSRFATGSNSFLRSTHLEPPALA
jgi:hypothetical protein